mmetsp:Transcript_9196/g.22546  ORF Transcript_9196/g.22546 Transcript_9196/m.22546 type:complete len:236 (+) Transcript_9196:2273-2980(+)
MQARGQLNDFGHVDWMRSRCRGGTRIAAQRPFHERPRRPLQKVQVGAVTLSSAGRRRRSGGREELPHLVRCLLDIFGEGVIGLVFLLVAVPPMKIIKLKLVRQWRRPLIRHRVAGQVRCCGGRCDFPAGACVIDYPGPVALVTVCGGITIIIIIGTVFIFLEGSPGARRSPRVFKSRRGLARVDDLQAVHSILIRPFRTRVFVLFDLARREVFYQHYNLLMLYLVCIKTDFITVL